MNDRVEPEFNSSSSKEKSSAESPNEGEYASGTTRQEKSYANLGERLSDLNSTINFGSADIYAHVAGALREVFITIAWQSVKAYYIFVIKLFMWAIVPLLTIVSILVELGKLSPSLFIICYSAIIVIIWTIIVFFWRKYNNTFHQSGEISRDSSSIFENFQNWISIRKIFGAIKSMISDVISGNVMPSAFLGFSIRIFGLSAFFFISYPEFLAERIEFSVEVYRNAIFRAEYFIYYYVVYEPIYNLFIFVQETLAMTGVNVDRMNIWK